MHRQAAYKFGKHYLLLLLLLGTVFSGVTFAATYMWTDKKGNVHITDDLGKVPPEHQPASTAKEPETPQTHRPMPNSPITPRQDGPTHRNAPGVRSTSSVFLGSWIANELSSYGFWALRLEQDGRGFAIGGGEKAIVRLTWRETDTYLGEIELSYSARNKQSVRIIYDRPRDTLRLESGALTFRRMSTPLPPLIVRQTSSRIPLSGLWARSLDLGSGSNYFLVMETDGSGMIFDRIPGGHAFTSSVTSLNSYMLTIVAGGRPYAELSPEQIKGLGKSLYMTYDPELDTVWISEGTSGSGMALYHIGEPIVTYARIGRGAGGNVDTLAGLKLQAEGGSGSAAVILGWAYANDYGGKRNNSEVMKWTRHAAELGNASAQCMLGAMLYSGGTVTPNKQEALKWLRASAAQNYYYAIVSLDEFNYRERTKKE